MGNANFEFFDSIGEYYFQCSILKMATEVIAASYKYRYMYVSTCMLVLTLVPFCVLESHF